MIDNRFNNYCLTDKEVSKILNDFENVIVEKASNKGKRNEDCEQEIRLQIYSTLIRNRKK
ncbi:MAG TPA: hypothetical protein OIM45_07020 [Clostridiaceae bacterium]|nr:hypothetical protein [Clostridiaceae bacterium]